MTTAKLEILFVDEVRKGEKNGKAWAIQTCQCAIHEDDGSIKVGELVLPKDIQLPARGYYDAEFKIGVGFDKKVTGFLVGLRPSSPHKVLPKV